MLSLFRSLRAAWIVAHLDAGTVALCHRNKIEVPTEVGGSTDNEEWGKMSFHLRSRLRGEKMEEFLPLFPQYAGQEVEMGEYLKSYDLSILPLNLLQMEGVHKFLPRFVGFKPAKDPYGVQRDHSVLIRQDGGRKFYLATRKPGYSTLLPILGSGAGRVHCPMGCAGCYRGEQTRFDHPLQLLHEDGSVEEMWMPRPIDQARWLVDRWNSDPSLAAVSDILWSGGEPMMLSNKMWGEILREMERADRLRTFRICTGSLFLGLPFRFDEEFIQLLVDFWGKTGVEVKLAVHVSHPENVTPEAIFFARRLRRAGIEILPQIPLEPGVNFWADDLDRSAQVLHHLDELLSATAGRPYKWILDLQGGVPLMQAIEVFRRVHDTHQGASNVSRPTTFDLLLPGPEGNISLSTHSLSAIESRVEGRQIHFRIPHPAGIMVTISQSL